MFKLKAVTMSPVQIGTGNYIDPFSYIIKDKELIRFDLIKLVSLFSDKERAELTYIIKNVSVLNFLKLRGFINQRFDKEHHMGAVLSIEAIPDNDFIDKYNKEVNIEKMNINDAINSLNILETYRSNNTPIIPGSSFKGALRTAILQKAKDNKVFNGGPRGTDEPTGTDDPFKRLYVSELQPNDQVKIKIGYYLNYAKDRLKEPKSESLQQATEVISQNQWFTCSVDIKTHFGQSVDYATIDKIILGIKSQNDLFKVVNSHYLELFKREYELFKKEAPEHSFLKGANNMIPHIESGKACVMKVGKHSGSMGITFKDRLVICRVGKDLYKELKEPTTFWYYSAKSGKNANPNLIWPCGWLLVTSQ